jgi:hypothetical protein
MRKICAGMAAAAFTFALAAPALAKVETVKGVLVDQACYKADKSNTGQTHKMKSGAMDNCATACAKMGQPVALVTTDGKVYQVTGELAANKNEKLVPHMAQNVELTGEVTAEKDGSMKIAANSLKPAGK